jgi:hypothetical protein
MKMVERNPRMLAYPVDSGDYFDKKERRCTFAAHHDAGIGP